MKAIALAEIHLGKGKKVAPGTIHDFTKPQGEALLKKGQVKLPGAEDALKGSALEEAKGNLASVTTDLQDAEKRELEQAERADGAEEENAKLKAEIEQLKADKAGNK